MLEGMILGISFIASSFITPVFANDYIETEKSKSSIEAEDRKSSIETNKSKSSSEALLKLTNSFVMKESKKDNYNFTLTDVKLGDKIIYKPKNGNTKVYQKICKPLEKCVFEETTKFGKTYEFLGYEITFKDDSY